MTNVYQATTPETTVTTASTANVGNSEPSLQFTPEELAMIRATRANPELQAKIEKITERAESEEASAVRGNVVTRIQEAVEAAMVDMIDTESESFIDGSQEYIKRVGKITTTCELNADGKAVVSTKSPRRKRDSESTTTA
jgi:hypothetical protein